MTDCRRKQVLEYFLENFSSEECLQNRTSACDNCLRKGEFKTIDATDYCKQIAICITDLFMGRQPFTLLHMVDILKGTKIKKLIEANHHEHRYYGLLKAWDKLDIQRLLHKMVIENYFMEEIKFMRDIPLAYLKIGPKIKDLMERNQRISFALREKTLQKAEITASVSTDPTISKELNLIYQQCYDELLRVVNEIASEKNIAIGSVMHMTALKTMSRQLPTTDVEMLKIQHVTKANYEKYGKKLLDIIQNYAAQKVILIADAAEANKSEDESRDWDQLMAQTSATPVNKRRANWGGKRSGSAKRFKKAKGKSPRKAARGKAAIAAAIKARNKFKACTIPKF